MFEQLIEYRKDPVLAAILSAGYSVDLEREVIASPGKFEGEHIATMFFWEKWNDSCADSDFGYYAQFILSNDEQCALGTTDRYFNLDTTESGFVVGCTANTLLEDTDEE